MSSAFEQASDVTLVAPNLFRAVIPAGWEQGRGAFGGLVLAILMRAIQKCEPDVARSVRTLIGDLVGPVVAGEAEITVDVLRRGANQSNMRAELRQGGQLLALASAVLSTPRPSGLPGLRPRVEVPPMDSAFEMPLGAPGTPSFTQYFRYRIATGLPFTASAVPEVTGFVREREDPATIDPPMMMALLDSFWPAFFATASEWRPIATVSFTAEIVADLAKLDPRAPLFYRARTLCEHEGFQPELREIFDVNGDLVALNHQTFAIIK